MVTIALRSDVGLAHSHIKEDLLAQVDGSNVVFTTSLIYKPGTLVVHKNGLSMLNGAANDFVESGPQEFTWVNDEIGPPQPGCTFWVYYERGDL